MSEPLLHDLSSGVLTLTLNRPASLNALDQRLLLMLTEATRAAADDPDVRVVVLRGAGRAFCAGGDMKSAADPDPRDPINAKQSREPGWPTNEMRADRILRHAEAPYRLHTMPKPTIAMVQGHAAGAGMALALACDLRVCAQSARFGTAYAAIGFSGDYGVSYLLPLVVGHAKARELMLLPRLVDAAEAAALGVATRVVADESLEAETVALARSLAEGPTLAYRYIKQNLSAAETASYAQVLQIETANLILSAATGDHQEARRAFREKRKPVFKGL